MNSPNPGDLPDVLGGFDLTDQARFADGLPYDIFARLRKVAPLLFHPPGNSPDGEGFWVVTRHADVAHVAADPLFSAQGGGGRAGGGSHLDDLPTGVYAGVLLPMMDNPRHDNIRALLSPAVTGDTVAKLEPGLRAIAADVIDAALAQGSVDFATDLAEPFAIRGVGLLLGVPEDDWAQLVAWGNDVVGFTNRRTGRVDDRSLAVVAAMTSYADTLLAAKRATPGDDLSTLIAHGDLTELERQSNLVLLLLTGGEQPRNILAEGALVLAHEHDQWRALRSDRSILPGGIEEILRWSAPNPYNRRTAVRDTQLHGTRIRAGDKVTIWWPSANHDESVFSDPTTFDVRRNPNPHLTFGHGTHYCLGADVARLELRVFLEELLDRVAELHVTGPVNRAPSNKHSVVLDMPTTLTKAS